jgi:hypothetical protein
MSDGKTAEAALASVKDAIVAWVDEAKVLGRPLGQPSCNLQAEDC